MADRVGRAFCPPPETRSRQLHRFAVQTGRSPRTIFHPDYYGAYVLDPDGNNIEAVCRRPESPK